MLVYEFVYIEVVLMITSKVFNSKYGWFFIKIRYLELLMWGLG